MTTSPTQKPRPGDFVRVNIKPYNPPNYYLGTVSHVLTKRKSHSRGFKVRLDDNVVGRVVEIISRC